jgi:hypothetical protein
LNYGGVTINKATKAEKVLFEGLREPGSPIRHKTSRINWEGDSDDGKEKRGLDPEERERLNLATLAIVHKTSEPKGGKK